MKCRDMKIKMILNKKNSHIELIGKCLKLYFKSIWKIIDSFLGEAYYYRKYPIMRSF